LGTSFIPFCKIVEDTKYLFTEMGLGLEFQGLVTVCTGCLNCWTCEVHVRNI